MERQGILRDVCACPMRSPIPLKTWLVACVDLASVGEPWIISLPRFAAFGKKIDEAEQGENQPLGRYV